MKPKIHPQYHTINIVMTDGTKYQTRSTWGKEGDTMTLDVDSKSHPAWTGGVSLRKTGQMEKFNNKFAAISGMNSKSAKSAPKAEAAATTTPASEQKGPPMRASTKAEAEKKAAKKEPKASDASESAATDSAENSDAAE